MPTASKKSRIIYHFDPKTGLTGELESADVCCEKQTPFWNAHHSIEMGIGGRSNLPEPMTGGKPSTKRNKGMTFEVVMQVINGLLKSKGYVAGIPTQGPGAVSEATFDVTVPAIVRSIVNLDEEDDRPKSGKSFDVPVVPSDVEMGATFERKLNEVAKQFGVKKLASTPAREMTQAEVDAEVARLSRM